jgi:hypothetical protein
MRVETPQVVTAARAQTKRQGAIDDSMRVLGHTHRYLDDDSAGTIVDNYPAKSHIFIDTPNPITTTSREGMRVETPQVVTVARVRGARSMALAERPGAHIPVQILRNINGLWDKSISGKREKNRKTGGYELPKEVLKGRGHQWGEDPYMVSQMGLDAGNPNIMPDAGRMMRRMTVRRQWHWDKGGELTGQPGFLDLGLIPPDVPILGNAGMKMPIK